MGSILNFVRSLENSNVDNRSDMPSSYIWKDTTQTPISIPKEYTDGLKGYGAYTRLITYCTYCSYLLYSPEFKSIRDELEKNGQLEPVKSFFQKLVGELRYEISDSWGGYRGDAFKYVNSDDERRGLTFVPFELGNPNSFKSLLNKVKAVKNPEVVKSAFEEIDLKQLRKKESQYKFTCDFVKNKLLRNLKMYYSYISSDNLIGISEEQFKELIETGNIKEFEENGENLKKIKERIKKYLLSIYNEESTKYPGAYGGREAEYSGALDVLFETGKLEELHKEIDECYEKINVPNGFKDAADFGNSLFWYGYDSFNNARYGCQTTASLYALAKAFSLKYPEEEIDVSFLSSDTIEAGREVFEFVPNEEQMLKFIENLKSKGLLLETKSSPTDHEGR